ncbi:MAG: hypothetical protein V4736_05770 [Bdellovibrionota bacterium]
MKINFNTLVLLITVSLLGSCVHRSGARIEASTSSLTETRKIISSIIGQPRTISENGRELTSFYSDDRGLKINDPTKVQTRWYSKVVILGDRRPYELTIDVNKESKDTNGEYYLERTDEAKSERLAKRIEKALHQSLDTRNVIDDFRAF